MAVYMDIKGTTQTSFQIGKGKPRLASATGQISVLNPDNTSSIFQSSSHRFYNDTAGFYASLAGSASMAANVSWVLPSADGTSGQILSTDGSGNLVWATASGAPSNMVLTDTTSFAFGTSSPIAMFTLPANAVVHRVEVIVDTAFDGTPTLEVGISGNTTKYMASSMNDLAIADRWVSEPNNIPVGTTEAIIGTYSAGGATVGAGRIIVHYSNPA